jgi:uncharacterized membrane protein
LAVARFRKSIAEVVVRAGTTAIEIAAGAEAVVIDPAIGAAAGAATGEVRAAAEGTGIAVGVADSRKNSWRFRSEN